MFDFSIDKIQICIDWQSYNDEPLKLYDCDFDAAMSGLDVYALLLNNERQLLSNSDFLYWGSEFKTENQLITSSDNSLVCLQSYSFYQNEEKDSASKFELHFDKINNNISEIIFIVGRPQQREQNDKWMDSKILRKVQNEFVDIFINIELINYSRTIKYFYNKFGAVEVLSIVKKQNKWVVNSKENYIEYTNGLFEVLNNHTLNI